MNHAQIATQLRIAAASGTYGQKEKFQDAEYVRKCSFTSAEHSINVIYTRDEGMSSGWFGNEHPALDKALHLSLGAIYIFPDGSERQRAVEAQEIRDWAKAIFGPDWRKAFLETASTPDGKFWGVLHIRVFANEQWQAFYPESYEDFLKELNWVPIQKAIATLERAEEIK